MQIKRKKGLRGVRIVEHNRVLGYIILFLIACLILTIAAIKIIGNGNSINVNNSSSECSLDSDCVAQRTGCCSCNMGGEEKCVTKTESAEIIKGLSKCKNVMCTAVYSCLIKSCSCNAGKCSAVY